MRPLGTQAERRAQQRSGEVRGPQNDSAANGLVAGADKSLTAMQISQGIQIAARQLRSFDETGAASAHRALEQEPALLATASPAGEGRAVAKGEAIVEFTGLARSVTLAVKPQHLKVPELNFRVEHPSEGAIREAVMKDPLLHQKVKDAAIKVYQRTEDQLVIATRFWDSEIAAAQGDEPRRKKALAEYETSVKDQVGKALSDAERDTEAVWNEFSHNKQEYSKYKWKAGIKLGLGVGSMITTAGIMASSAATFGVSAIPGVLGMVRSTAHLAGTCRGLMKSLDKVVKELNSTLLEMDSTYKNASKSKVGSTEAGAMLMHKVFAVETNSLKKCETLLDQGKNKLNGVIVTGHKIAKQLNKVLDAVDETAKKSKPQDAKKLEPIADRVEQMLQRVSVEVERAEHGRRELQRLETDLLEPLRDKKPAALAHLEKALISIDLASGVSAWSDLVQNVSYSVVELAADKITDAH